MSDFDRIDRWFWSATIVILVVFVATMIRALFADFGVMAVLAVVGGFVIATAIVHKMMTWVKPYDGDRE